MRKKCVRLLAGVILVIVLKGQQPESAEIKGDVRRDHTVIFERLMIALYDYSSHQELASVPLGPDGSFTFRQVPFKTLAVRITTEMGDVVQESLVVVNQRTQPVEIRMAYQRMPGRHPDRCRSSSCGSMLPRGRRSRPLWWRSISPRRGNMTKLPGRRKGAQNLTGVCGGAFQPGGPIHPDEALRRWPLRD